MINLQWKKWNFMSSLFSVFTPSWVNKRVETDIVHNALTFLFGYVTLKHITEMFNDIFGEVLRTGFTEVKPPDPGETQAIRKGNFLIKCRLQRIFNFFIVSYLAWKTHAKKTPKTHLIKPTHFKTPSVSGLF